MRAVTSELDVMRRSEALFESHRQQVLRGTDRLFAYLMCLQFVGGLVAALVISPRTWSGSVSHVHLHVWAALGIGGLIASLPVALALLMPGRFLTRCMIAVGQMLTSALLIHLTGGRIETHFHVFGSLAFLAFYRDWRIFIPATIVVGVDHLVRGIVWPESVYGVLSASPWRSVEHAGWVLFENAFLIRSCILGVREMRSIAENRARLEITNARIEDEVLQRTAELRQQKTALECEVAERKAAEESLREVNLALTNAMPGISRLDALGNYVRVNPAYAEMMGYQPDELVGTGWEPTVHPDDRSTASAAYQRMLDDGAGEFEALAVRKDGSTFYKQVLMVRIGDDGQRFQGHYCFMRDITERKRAERERESLQEQLLVASRRAGMAEVATGVLHNVGNVLNSVNVSANLAAGRMRQFDLAALAGVAGLIETHGDDLAGFFANDERGKLVPRLLQELSRHLGEEQSGVITELESLTRCVEHIKEIVGVQQAYARVSGVYETVAPAHLVEDALRINQAALERHRVRVVREFEVLPPITVDKQRVLQILVNLIGNAKYALDGRESDKVLRIRIARLHDSEEFARIEVIDNGVGIAPENLTRIFAHGFTTRKDGHGFGLHSAALFAREFGGRLTVRSDGPGLGAAFSLDIPVRAKREETQDEPCLIGATA